MTDIKKHLVQRVIDWNHKRYAKIFNYKLSKDLLYEELTELIEAETTIDKLDAVGDIVFVAIGSLWKMGIKSSDIEQLLSVTYENLDNYVFELVNKYDLSYAKSLHVSVIAQSIAFSCLQTLRNANMSKALLIILKIICDSNDTKSLPADKVDPSVKANIDKGNTYVGPEAALKELINNYSLEYIENINLDK